MAPPFTGSDVPLEEDILRKTKPFTESRTEFDARTAEQQILFATSTGTMITVPPLKTLWINSAFASCRNTLAVGAANIGTANTIIIQSHCEIGGQSAVAMPYPMALKFEEGSVISATITGTGMVGLQGFLVDKKIS